MIPVADQTIDNWWNGRRPRDVKSFYDYVVSEQTPGLSDPAQALIAAVRVLFPPMAGQATHQNLHHLEGHYALKRQRWAPLHSKEFIECPVAIRCTGEKVIFKETQSFGDEKKSERVVEESYTGYVFQFGLSLWIIAHEQNLHSVKFLTIHDCDPPLSANARALATGKGNLIAVNGAGPNVSHRFFLRRVETPVRSRVLSEEQFKLDREAYDYVVKSSSS